MTGADSCPRCGWTTGANHRTRMRFHLAYNHGISSPSAITSDEPASRPENEKRQEPT